MKKQYIDCGRSYELQRAFRAKWAAQKAEQLKTTREMSQSSVDVDERAVTYQPLSVICREEGGLAADWAAACNYVAKCINLAEAGILCRGRPWILYNEFTGRFEFAYLKKQFRSSFIQQWTALTKLQSDGKQGELGDGGSSGSGQDIAGKASGKALGKASGKALSANAAGGEDDDDDKKLIELAGSKGGKDGKSEGGDGTAKGGKGQKRSAGESGPQDLAAKKARQDLQNMWKKATDVRAKASTTISSFHMLEQNISMDTNWGWAEGKEQTSLRSLKQDLDSFARSSCFWRDFFLVDIAALKKKYSDATAASKHLLGLEECSNKIMALNKQAKKMMSMHDAMLKC
jgi:hypothetical protein